MKWFFSKVFHLFFYHWWKYDNDHSGFSRRTCRLCSYQEYFYLGGEGWRSDISPWCSKRLSWV